MLLIKKIVGRIHRLGSWLLFRIKYPSVPIIHPLSIGTYYSQEGQDLYLSSLMFNYLRNHSDAWVVDVGANHPEHFSNSLYFEKFYGCRILAIDALAELGEAWAILRPGAMFYPTALGGSDGYITLNIPIDGNCMFASVEGGVQKSQAARYEERQVPVTSLQRLLIEFDIDTVALLSIDVEGFELDVLKGIDFERVVIKAIVVENNSISLYGSDEIRDFLTKKDFLFYARIGYLDDVFLHRSMINGLSSI